jgi:hypothetical protein
MKPSFAKIKKTYQDKHAFPRDVLYQELGWDDLVNNPAYENTCAVRISLALIKLDITLPGRLMIKQGPHKGKMIEPGQAKLSHLLARPTLLGAPEKCKMADVHKVVGNRHGIIAFFKIPEYRNGGHIDLIQGRSIKIRRLPVGQAG